MAPVFARFLVALVAVALAATGAISAEMPPEWVWPMHETAEPEEGVLTLVTHYPYSERRYETPILVERPVPEVARRQGTPEEAMISRVSAMMAGEYEAWLDTWDEASRRLTIANNEAEGRTSDYFLQWWEDTFRFARIALVRRIETGPYVVVTYRLLTPSGEDAGNGVEFPAVFREVDGRWLATLDLRADPLVPASPWVSGETRMERTVR